jgi:hypothetical protein
VEYEQLAVKSVNQRFVSIDCLASTRLDKSPRRGAKKKRIKTLLHEGDDPIRQLMGAHIVGFVRWYILVLGCCHLSPASFPSPEFSSRVPEKLTGVTRGSFGMRVVPVAARSGRNASKTSASESFRIAFGPIYSFG